MTFKFLFHQVRFHFTANGLFKPTLLLLVLYTSISSIRAQQVKILFDASKAETAGNADWVIDEDLNNMTWNPNATVGSGSEGNAQRWPTPAQSGITSTTTEGFWKGALSAWGIDCVKRGYFVESLPYNGSITFGNSSNAQDLSNYKVFVITEPNILFTASEKTAILQFVQNGGGLFLIADHINSDRNNDGEDSPEIFNDLFLNNTIQSNPFGFMFDSVSISPLSSNIPNLPSDSLLHGPMGNVTQVMWASGNTMTLYPNVNPSVKGIVYNTGMTFGNKGVMVCYARFGKGKIVAMGDSSPADDGTGDTGDNLYDGWIADASGNHQRLIMNGTIWLANKDSLANIPNRTDLAIDSIRPNQFQRGFNDLKVYIHNNGNSIVSDLMVYIKTDSESVRSFNITGINLKPNDTAVFEFSKISQFNKSGFHQIKAWIAAPLDSIRSNDTLTKNPFIPYITSASLTRIVHPDTLKIGINLAEAMVFNTGDTRIDSIMIKYTIGKDSVIETHNNLNLVPFDSLSFTFDKPITIDQAGEYEISFHLVKYWSSTDSNVGNQLSIKRTAINTSCFEILAAEQFDMVNPVSGNYLNLNFKKPFTGKIIYSDIQGRVLYENEVENKLNCALDCTKMNDGLYILLFQNDKGSFYKRILKTSN